MLFRRTPAILLFFFWVKLAAQTTDGQADGALETLENTLGEVYLGTTEAQFLELKSSASRADDGGLRDVFSEKIGRDGIGRVSYFFEKETAGHLLYEIDVDFADEKLLGEAVRRELGEPNLPGRADHWVVSAEPGDPTVTLAWLAGRKFVLASNLPGSEWEGSEKFVLPPGFDFESLATGGATPFPEELEGDAAEKTAFFDLLEKQIEAAPGHFQKLRGPLLGEPGSGVVECNAPLNLAESANISQDDEANWRLTNFLASGLDEVGALEYGRQLTELLLKNPLKNFRLQPAGKTTDDGIEETTYEILTKKGKLTGTRLIVTRGFYEEEGGWAVDLSIVLN